MSERIDRRSFLRLMAGAGAVVAASQLPAIAAPLRAHGAAGEKPQAANSGSHELLTMAYAVVNIGLERPFSVLHFSDTHLTSVYPHESETKQYLHRRRTETFGGQQEQSLAATLAWARDNVDYVVCTGDLIDYHTEANFDLVRKYFGGHRFGAMGNHEFNPDLWRSNPREEHTEAFKERSRAALRAAYDFDPTFCSQVVEGVNFVALDNVYGTVTAEQVALFAEEVRRGLPIVLCMHVPLFTDTIWRARCKFWPGAGKRLSETPVAPPEGDWLAQLSDPTTREWIDSLRREPLLRCVLTGHLHFTMDDRFSPTAMQYVVGSNCLFHAREVIFT